MTYAIISLGGKQYKVEAGQRMLVDRLPQDEGATLEPRVLLAGGDGDTRLSPDDVVVTARVVGHVLGDKVRIGKYRPKTGYRRHTGFRAKLSRIEIEGIGAREATAPARKRKAEASEPPAESPPAAETAETAQTPTAEGGEE